MHIENDIKLDYSDVLIRPKRSTLGSRADVDITREFMFKHSLMKYHGVPIMAANMYGVGSVRMTQQFQQNGMFVCLHKNADLPNVESVYDKDKNIVNHMALTLGISASLDEVKDVLSVIPFKYLCLDVANGYTEKFVDYVKRARQMFPFVTIIAGNVVTADITEQLIYAGADIVKIGIGPGGQCTTRLVTGVGYPQLSAVIECADAAHGLGGHVIADGGIVHPGDVAKAFGAGADFVMIGSMFAGHDEGFDNSEVKKVVEHNGKPYIEFYGSSSETAMLSTVGYKADYRASEGRTTLVPFKGDVQDTVVELLGGLRSSMTYIGAKKLREISKRTTFIRVNNTHNQTYESATVGK